MLPHHPAAKQAHHHQHHGVEPHGRQAQPGVDRQHRRQGEGIGQGGVGEAEHRKAQQAPHVFHIAGGATDHLAAAGALHPARFLLKQVVKDLLLEIGLHLPPHAKHQHPRQQPHRPHHGGQQQDQGRLVQQGVESEAVVQVVDHPTHLERNRHAQHVHHHQRQGPQQHRLPVGPEVTPDQIGPRGTHAALVPSARQPRELPSHR